MLLRLFTGGFDLVMWLITAFCVLLCLTVHEVAHGLAAYKLGDDTAKRMGRLTLNPIPHIDPAGGLMMLLTEFGWAKPVPVNARNFTRKINMRTGMAITAFAGPFSNLIFALVAVVVMFILRNFGVIDFVVRGGRFYTTIGESQPIFTMLFVLISLNIGLALFYLIPIPPLDGSWIMSAVLPYRLSEKYSRIFAGNRMMARFSVLILFGLIVWTPFGGFLMLVREQILAFLVWLVQLIPFF